MNSYSHDTTRRGRSKIEGINHYIVEGLPLKTYDCSQITDGYAALIPKRRAAGWRDSR